MVRQDRLFATRSYLVPERLSPTTIQAHAYSLSCAPSQRARTRRIGNGVLGLSTRE